MSKVQLSISFRTNDGEFKSKFVELVDGLANGQDIARTVGTTLMLAGFVSTEQIQQRIDSDPVFAADVIGAHALVNELYTFKMDAHEVTQILQKLVVMGIE